MLTSDAGYHALALVAFVSLSAAGGVDGPKMTRHQASAVLRPSPDPLSLRHRLVISHDAFPILPSIVPCPASHAQPSMPTIAQPRVCKECGGTETKVP